MAGNKGPSISIAADTKDAAKGIRDGIIEPLEDARDVIAELATDSKKLDTLEDNMTDAARETEQVRDELDKLNKSIRETGRAGSGIGKDFKDGTRDAKEGVGELRDEANSTAKEAAASFDGSAESIVDAFQEVAANAFAGFGPAGIVAGLAVAAGIGIATSEFQKNEEAAKQAKERIREYGLAVIESGAEVAGLEQFQENLKAIVTESDDATKNLKQIDAFANRFKQYGVDADNLAMAFAGNSDAIEEIVTQLEDAAEAERNLADLATNQGTRDLYLTRAKDATTYIDELRKVQEETQRAQEIEQNWLATGGEETLAKAEAIKSINDAYDDAAGSVLEFVNQETGALNIEAFIASIQARKDALNQYQVDLATMGLTTEQKRALDAMGIDAAMAYLDGIKKGTPEQAQYLKDSLTEAAKDSSGTAKTEIETAFAKPTKHDVDVEAKTADATRAINRWIESLPKQLQFRAVVLDRDGRPVI